MRTTTIPARIQYIRDLYCLEDGILQIVDRTIRELDHPIHIAPEDARLLQVLLKLHKAQVGVELGSLAGYSTIWLGRALPENGKLYSIERDVKRYEMTKKSLAMSGLQNVELILGDAKDKLQELKGPFDFIFIDANKSAYLDYLDWADIHIKPGGLIIADNTLLFDEVYQDTPIRANKKAHQVMQQFNLRLTNRTKYEAIMLPTSDGLTIAVKL